MYRQPIVTRLRAVRPWFDSRQCWGRNFLSFRHRIGTGSGPTQPHIQWVLGTVFPGIKRPVREADKSPLSRAEVKKAWCYTSLPP